MTDLELEALDTLELVLGYHTAAVKRLSLREYTEMVGTMRDTVKHLLNAKLGCSSGLHSGLCTCLPGSPGKSTCLSQRKRAK